MKRSKVVVQNSDVEPVVPLAREKRNRNPNAEDQGRIIQGMELEFEPWKIKRNPKLQLAILTNNNRLAPIEMFLACRFLSMNGWNVKDVQMACSKSTKLRVEGNFIGCS